MKRIKSSKVKGQILVITILVILLLSIIIIGIIAVVTRDTEQSVNTRQYEVSYNQSETAILKILDRYADTSVVLGGLPSEADMSCSGPVGAKYSCTMNEGNLRTILSIEDTNIVEDYELAKDQSFIVDLTGNYKGSLEIRWSGEVAMEFSLDYQNTDYEYITVKDVYDGGNYVLSENVSSHPLAILIPEPGKNFIRVNIATTVTGSNDPLRFRIRALMDDYTTTLLSVRPLNDGLLPQVRHVEAVTYVNDASSPSSSAPILVSQIPLKHPMPEIFDYTIRSVESVEK